MDQVIGILIILKFHLKESPMCRDQETALHYFVGCSSYCFERQTLIDLIHDSDQPHLERLLNVIAMLYLWTLILTFLRFVHIKLRIRFSYNL